MSTASMQSLRHAAGINDFFAGERALRLHIAEHPNEARTFGAIWAAAIASMIRSSQSHLAPFARIQMRDDSTTWFVCKQSQVRAIATSLANTG